jgi:hypothetical protein
METDVSEERATSIFLVENDRNKESGCVRWLGRWQVKVAVCSSETSLHIRTTRRYIPGYGNTITTAVSTSNSTLILFNCRCH